MQVLKNTWLNRIMNQLMGQHYCSFPIFKKSIQCVIYESREGGGRYKMPSSEFHKKISKTKHNFTFDSSEI